MHIRVRILSVFLITALCPFGALHAQEVTAEQKQFGVWLDQFAVISGAWYLNRRCDHLSPELSREFDWHVGKVNVALADMLGKPDMLYAIQNSAKQVAQKQICSPRESMGIVVLALDSSRQMSYALTGKRYQPIISDNEVMLEQYYSVAVALEVERICLFWEESMRKEVFEVYDKVTQVLQEDFKDEIQTMQQDVGEKAKGLGFERCKDQAVRHLSTQALRMLRELERVLGLQ